MQLHRARVSNAAKSIVVFIFILSPLLTLGSRANAYYLQDATLIPLNPSGFQDDTPTMETAVSSATPSPILLVTDTPFPTITAAEPSSTVTLESVPLEGEYVPDELLVRFRRSASPEAMNDCLGMIGASVQSEPEFIQVLRVRVPSGGMAAVLNQLRNCPGVRYVEPNYLVHALETIPSDPAFGLQYGLVNIRAPQGWDLSTGSSTVTIAIVDSGVDFNHLDLASKLVPGYDFFNNDPIAQDDNGHGTHVAGIAAAVGDNATGITGVSWGARILPVKVLNASGNGTYADVAAGIIWATDQGAQVINLSLGGANPSQVLQDAVGYAYTRGVVLVAASGNSGSSSVLYPARYQEVIAVAGTDASNNRAAFSNYGPEIDLSAPGVSIYSTNIGGYGYRTGTSMAAPFVSGLAAILRGIPGNDSPDAIAFEMKSTALDLELPGIDNLTGFGLIQMDAALHVVKSGPTQTLAAATVIFPTPPVFTSTFTQRPSPDGLLGPGPTGIYSPSASPVSASPSPSAVTPTLILTPTAIQSGVETSEVIALNLPPPLPPSSQPQSWVLPCLGTVLILLGILLFLAPRRSRRKYHGLRR